MAARRFLWVVAVLIMLTIGAAFAYRLFGQQIMRVALVPTVSFEASPKASGPDYALAASWLARPDIPGNPATWTPEGYQPAPKPAASTFYLAPTAYLRRDRWNAPFDDKATNERLEIFTRSQASVFNGVSDIWAPRYRQATFGAFLTDREDAAKALDLAYGDVLRAFDSFVASLPADRPIILAGHSQGSLHLLRLLKERVAGQPLASRIVAAYVVGWPISEAVDIPALGLPPCTAQGQSGCILSWQSFAEPADPSMILAVYDKTPGDNGQPRKGTAMVCVNPLLGQPSSQPASPELNLGALVPNGNLSNAALEPRRVGARCDERGFLLIGQPPENFGNYVLPGNNYHVYDYTLFWANLRSDIEARLNDYLTNAKPAVTAPAEKPGLLRRIINRVKP